MARVFVLHPGAGSDLRTTENHSCGGSGVHTCHLRPGGCGSKRVGVKGRSQLCNKFKASQSHLEVLSFKERKKERKKTYRVQQAHSIWEAGKENGSGRLPTRLGYIARSCCKE